jgi:RHS repeat-associated protein
VRFRHNTSERERTVAVERHGGRRSRHLHGNSNIEKIELAAGHDVAALVAQLSADPAIELVEPNFLIKTDQTMPNDPRLVEQWALNNTGQTGGPAGADISAVAAWQTSTGASTTVIAVIDSGIDFTHPDLANNQWTNAGEAADGQDEDQDGFVDDLHGWDWVGNSNQVADQNGHGTAVAGIIAAEGNNHIGVAGVMWRASLMSLRVLDNTGMGDVANAVEAIDYAVAHGAHIINLSWGTDAPSQMLQDALGRAAADGVLVVCSAGNGGRNIEDTPYYPAAYDLPNLIAVGATDNTDNLTSWSNWGANHVAVAAPGANILTTKMGGDYQAVSGTSAAAPMVSGVAGLVETLRPGLDAAGLRTAIVNGARQTAALYGKVSSGGVINASGAFNALSTVGGGSGADGSGSTNGGAGQGHPPVVYPTPGHGSGGQGAGGSFDVAPPEQTSSVPGSGLPNLDTTHGRQPNPPSSSAPIQANSCMASDPACSGTTAGGVTPSGDDRYVASARSQPQNQTGRSGAMAIASVDEQAEVNLGSRNYNWALPLVSLPGRAGLDLNLTLYYNSLVWTKDAASNVIEYNADQGFPAPGFRLGLPYIQEPYTDLQRSKNSYLLITPSGGRIALTRVGTTNVYEAADGSYTQLTDNLVSSNNLLVRLADGTQLMFAPAGYRGFVCTQIKDRNGNYISATYYTQYPKMGLLNTLTDTLGRVITFNYNTDNNLDTITQSWGGATHQWAKFYYGSVLVNPNFSGLDVYGPVNTNITVLTRVDIGDGSFYGFYYENPWGIANRFSRYAPDATSLAYTFYNIPSTNSPQTDCPRFTERRDWARQWNVQNGVEQEAVTSYGTADNVTWTMPDGTQLTGTRTQVTTPDGTTYKTYAKAAGWEQTLPLLEETWAAGALAPNKRVTTAWTQDDTSVAYQLSPRITETNIYDDAGNRRRTTISYNSVAVGSITCHLPETVRAYAADATTVLRRTLTAYRWDQAFMDRRIIGLTAWQETYEGESTLVSRLEYAYDWVAGYMSATAPTVQHDTANYGSSFSLGRGILVAVYRYDVSNMPQGIWIKTFGYNLAGETVWTADPAGHRTSFSYADSFSDTDPNRGTTLAYPTTITNADIYSSTVQYNFYTGAVTRRQDPKGAFETLSYDSAGRLERVTNGINNGYKRWVYWPDGLQVLSYETIQAGAGEAYSNTIVDGAGRARAVAAENPNSIGGYTGQLIAYDKMGRVSERTNPTEMTGNWAASDSDAATGWQKTLQAYDYKGRPTLTTNADGSTTELSYGGCGCAGGEVTTARDERGRRTRYTKDALGRLWKVEELTWEQTVYATTTYTYNARDQITNINQAGQTRTLQYDGQGRLWKETTPEQGTTEYSYNSDDTVQWTQDARLVKTNLAYNNRHLVTSLTYDLTGVLAGQNVAPTANVSFTYDEAGNRTSMTDGAGSATYHYDMLSRMDWETRTFNGLSGTYSLIYSYNLAGELTRLVNATNSTRVNYNYDKVGRVTSITGTDDAGLPTYAGVSSYAQNLSYRAFGALKGLTYGNNLTLSLQYDTRMRLTDWTVPGILGWQYSYTDAGENTGRVMFARNTVSAAYGATTGGRDDTLDRSYDYDQVGRLVVAHTGYEARVHMNRQTASDPTTYGAYSHSYGYDVQGNMTRRIGWGGVNNGYVDWTLQYTNNRQQVNLWTGQAMQYDASGNLTYDGQSYQYDATGQQVVATGGAAALAMSYEGNRLRVKKVEGAATTYYQRSTVLRGQVMNELNGSGVWTRGYVYAGGQLLAVQQSNTVSWVAQDPVTKSQRVTAQNGTVTSVIDLDPWGGETTKSANQAFQPHRYTTYERDGNGGDEAQQRRYQNSWMRLAQPDPSKESYDLTDPQSFNRYSYVQNDPVNFIDPTGLDGVPGGTMMLDHYGSWFFVPFYNEFADPTYANDRTQSLAGVVGLTDGGGEMHLANDWWGIKGFGQSMLRAVAPSPQKTNIFHCFDNWRFAKLANFIGGPKLEAVAEFVDVGSEVSLLSDLQAMSLKATRTGIGGTEKVAASGLNRLFRAAGKRLGLSSETRGVLTAVGDVATPVLAVVGSFAAGYNAAIFVQCGLGVMQ